MAYDAGCLQLLWPIPQRMESGKRGYFAYKLASLNNIFAWAEIYNFGNDGWFCKRVKAAIKFIVNTALTNFNCVMQFCITFFHCSQLYYIVFLLPCAHCQNHKKNTSRL
jgi:hypothetical protein